MNRFLTLAGAALITATLAACSSGINNGLAHRITFDSNGLVVHAMGHPNAYVSRKGDLRIDGKNIAVTQAQRQLLQHYYVQARSTMDSGKAMGKQGIAMAERGIGDAISSIFHKDSTVAEKRMDAESQKIGSAANALCANIKSLGTTQLAIAAQIPAFAPYAAGDQMRCTITHGTTTAHSSGNPASASTTIVTVQ